MYQWTLFCVIYRGSRNLWNRTITSKFILYSFGYNSFFIEIRLLLFYKISANALFESQFPNHVSFNPPPFFSLLGACDPLELYHFCWKMYGIGDGLVQAICQLPSLARGPYHAENDWGKFQRSFAYVSIVFNYQAYVCLNISLRIEFILKELASVPSGKHLT